MAKGGYSVVETTLAIRVTVPEPAFEVQVVTYLNNISQTLTEALKSVNILSASVYKPHISLVHTNDHSKWSDVLVQASHKITNNTGSVLII